MLIHRETLYGNEVEQVSKHEQTCYEFGYETDNALTVAYNCSDLHKTDQVLGIARADQRQYPLLFIK